MDPGLAGGDLAVVVVIDVHVDQAGQLLQRLAGQIDLAAACRVQVEEPVLHQAEADPFPVVIQDRDLALVFGLPGHRPGVLHRVRVLVHQIFAPGHARGVDRVRDGVLPVLVVERIGEVRPGLGNVRQVAVVQRLNELGLDQLAEHVHRDAHEDIEAEPAAQLGQRLVHRVERGQRDLALVFLGEVVQAGLVDVGDPVEDLQRRAGLGGQAAGNRLVDREDRPQHRVARPRQRYGGPACQGRRASTEQGSRAAGEQAGRGAAPQEAAPG